MSRLRGSELTRLLDFLDRVCTLLSAFRPATKRALQTLDVIPSNDGISTRCLRKLQAICGHHAALPPSYFASGEIVRVSDHPIAVGGISDVWEGTYRDKRVSIERLKVPLNDDQGRKKVRVWYRKPLVRLLKNTRKDRSRSSNRRLCGKGFDTRISSLSSGSQRIRCRSSRSGCRTEP